MRVIRRHPVFSLSVIVSIAIGVSASAALIALVESITRGRLPFANADRVETIFMPHGGFEGATLWAVPREVIPAVAAKTDIVEQVGAYLSGGVRLRRDDQTNAVSAIHATVNLPTILGLRMALGRSFGPNDASGPPLAILGYALWQDRFAADSSVVNRAVDLGGVPHIVVGVAAPRAMYPGEQYVMTSDLTHRPTALNAANYVTAFALMRRGVDRRSARTALGAAATPVLGPARATGRPRFVAATSFRSYLVNPLLPFTQIMSIFAVFIALVASVNFAGLLLARGIRRRAELGMRAALGASVRQLAGHIVGECIGLCVLGGIVGAALAPVLVQLMAYGLPSIVPTWTTLTLGWGTVAASVAIAVGLGVLFGVGPALDLARPALTRFTRTDTGKTSQSRAAARTRASLVAFQVALASGVLIAMGTLVGSRIHLRPPSPGFPYEQILIGSAEHRQGADDMAEASLLAASLRDAPGVVGTAVVATNVTSSVMVIGGDSSARTLERSNGSSPLGVEELGDFYRTVGTRLVDGRLPTPAEEAARAPVAVATRALAARIGAHPLGVRLQFVRFDHTMVVVTIVGVIEDIRWRGSSPGFTQLLVMPMGPKRGTGWRDIEVWSRVSGPPGAAIRGLAARAARAGGPPYENIRPLAVRWDSEGLVYRTITRFCVALVGVSLLLAGIGLYGMIAYAAEVRARELAIREALGATRRRIAAITLRSAAIQAVVGAAGGVALGWIAIYLLTRGRTELYSRAAFGASLYALVFVGVTVLLSAVGPLRALWRRDLSAVLRG